MAKTNPLQFMQQVRNETSKVVWPNRRETMLTTGMVFVLSTVFAIFFFFVDQIIRLGLEAYISLAS